MLEELCEAFAIGLDAEGNVRFRRRADCLDGGGVVIVPLEVVARRLKARRLFHTYGGTTSA